MSSALERANYYIRQLDVLKAVGAFSENGNGVEEIELGEHMFPKDAKVIKFIPGKLLKLGIRKSRAERVLGGLICLPHFIMFPALFFGGMVLLPSIGHVGCGVGGGIGLAFWVWRNWLGPYVSIDLVKKTSTEVGPCLRRRHRPADIEVRSTQAGGIWTTRLSISGLVVVERKSLRRPEATDLTNFANALTGHAGGMVEIGHGVFICR